MPNISLLHGLLLVLAVVAAVQFLATRWTGDADQDQVNNNNNNNNNNHNNNHSEEDGEGGDVQQVWGPQSWASGRH